MRGHLHSLSPQPFAQWLLRYHELDPQSGLLKQWPSEAAASRESPLRCFPLYLVDSAAIEAPPPKANWAARLVLTLCRGSGEQTAVSFGHEDVEVLHQWLAAIVGQSGTVPATRAALEQSSALRLLSQGPVMHGWLLKKRDVMAGWLRRFFVLWRPAVESEAFLVYYQEPMATSPPRGVARLQECALLAHEDGSLALHKLADGQRLMLLDACDAHLRAAWMRALAEATVGSSDATGSEPAAAAAPEGDGGEGGEAADGADAAGVAGASAVESVGAAASREGAELAWLWREEELLRRLAELEAKRSLHEFLRLEWRQVEQLLLAAIAVRDDAAEDAAAAAEGGAAPMEDVAAAASDGGSPLQTSLQLLQAFLHRLLGCPLLRPAEHGAALRALEPLARIMRAGCAVPLDPALTPSPRPSPSPAPRLSHSQAQAGGARTPISGSDSRPTAAPARWPATPAHGPPRVLRRCRCTGC